MIGPDGNRGFGLTGRIGARPAAGRGDRLRHAAPGYWLYRKNKPKPSDPPAGELTEMRMLTMFAGLSCPPALLAAPARCDPPATPADDKAAAQAQGAEEQITSPDARR